jgi:hypothetical protein
MKPIVDEIKELYGYEGIAAYNSLIQKDLKDLLAFSYPPGYRSSIESPSEPEDRKDYLNRIYKKRSLYGDG